MGCIGCAGGSPVRPRDTVCRASAVKGLLMRGGSDGLRVSHGTSRKGHRRATSVGAKTLASVRSRLQPQVSLRRHGRVVRLMYGSQLAWGRLHGEPAPATVVGYAVQRPRAVLASIDDDGIGIHIVNSIDVYVGH